MSRSELRLAAEARSLTGSVSQNVSSGRRSKRYSVVRRNERTLIACTSCHARSGSSGSSIVFGSTCEGFVRKYPPATRPTRSSSRSVVLKDTSPPPEPEHDDAEQRDRSRQDADEEPADPVDLPVGELEPRGRVASHGHRHEVRAVGQPAERGEHELGVLREVLVGERIAREDDRLEGLLGVLLGHGDARLEPSRLAAIGAIVRLPDASYVVFLEPAPIGQDQPLDRDATRFGPGEDRAAVLQIDALA